MPRLYFKYGTMGSSKSAQALMARFNYMQKGMKVLLVKPSVDNRGDGEGTPKIRSRIGLEAECKILTPDQSLVEMYNAEKQAQGVDCIILDEAQFCTKEQIDECKALTKEVPVLCYGLLTNFKCELFEGSKRLVEIADSLNEIKSVCKCGRKASINARFVDGKLVDDGPVVLIGGDECYENMCYWCWKKELQSQGEKEK